MTDTTRQRACRIFATALCLAALAVPAALAATDTSDSTSTDTSTDTSDDTSTDTSDDTVLTASGSGTGDDIAGDTDTDILDDADVLAEGWEEEAFWGTSSSSVSAMANYGSSYFDGNDLVVYETLADDITAVASDGGTTKWTIGFGDDGTWETTGDVTITNGAIDASAAATTAKSLISSGYASTGLSDIQSSLIVASLMADLPYEFYWFDKTTGWYYFYAYSYTVTATSGSTTGTYTFQLSLGYAFYVSDDYADADATTPELTVDGTLAATTLSAVANAKAIVEEYSSVTNVKDLLEAYRDEICELASYDSDAASGSVSYGNPWQLTYVFDGDDDTTVVCEGYTKSFQYLCDLTWPDNSPLQCWTVTGILNASETHMFNLVAFTDSDYDGYGEGSWLVDVTNCDTGTAGAAGGLFLDAPTSGTSYTSTYTFTATAASGAQTSVTYAYDSTTIALYGSSVLTLAESDFPEAKHHISASDVTLSTTSYTYDGTAKTPDVTVSHDGTELEEDTDYTVSYADNTNAGTASVTVEGCGDWSGSACAYFVISKASQDVSLDVSADLMELVDALHVGSSFTNELNGAVGEVEYASSDTDVATVDSDGCVTITGGGEVTITATALATDNYAEASLAYAVRGEAHDLTAVEAVEPTCTEDGCEAYWVCSVCSRMFSDAEATDEISSTSELTVEATGHTWGEAVVVTEATCTTAGSSVTTCSVCGETVTTEIAATGHTYTDAPIWEFASDFSSATATFTCTAEDCSQTATATTTDITSEVTVEPTTTATGVRTWTATLYFGGETWTGEYAETLEMLSDDTSSDDTSDGTTDDTSSSDDASDGTSDTTSSDASDGTSTGTSTDISSGTSAGTSADSSTGTTSGSTKAAGKRANTMKVKVKKVVVRTTGGVLDADVKIKAKKVLVVKKAKGKVTCRQLGKAAGKLIHISKKGTLTLRKGLEAGTYKLKVKVSAAGNATYAAASKCVHVTITVK